MLPGALPDRPGRTRYPLRRRIRLVGLGRTLGKRVGGNPSRVRISHPPPSPVPVREPVQTVARRPEVAIPDSEPSRRAGVAAAVLLATAAVCLGVTQVLGPSATEPPLGRHDASGTPPWHLDAAPPDWLVVLLPAVAVVAGALCLGLFLTGRWRPRPARLSIAGVLVVAALSMLPPIGSADTLSYAAYGRMVATGHDPYSTTPAELARTGDPVAAAVEVPWQQTP